MSPHTRNGQKYPSPPPLTLKNKEHKIGFLLTLFDLCIDQQSDVYHRLYGADIAILSI